MGNWDGMVHHNTTYIMRRNMKWDFHRNLNEVFKIIISETYSSIIVIKYKIFHIFFPFLIAEQKLQSLS